MQRKILSQWPLPNHTPNYQLLQQRTEIRRSPCILQIPAPLGLLMPTPCLTSTTAGTHSQHLCTQSPAPPTSSPDSGCQPHGLQGTAAMAKQAVPLVLMHSCSINTPKGKRLLLLQQAFLPGNFSATFTAGVLELWGSICSCRRRNGDYTKELWLDAVLEICRAFYH